MTALPVMMDEPEDLLDSIRAARSGDSRAFETIMRATERRVDSLAWRLLGDAEYIKEALHETFLPFYRVLGKYDEQSYFFGRLYRITVNVCRDLESRRRFC